MRNPSQGMELWFSFLSNFLSQRILLTLCEDFPREPKSNASERGKRKKRNWHTKSTYIHACMYAYDVCMYVCMHMMYVCMHLCTTSLTTPKYLWGQVRESWRGTVQDEGACDLHRPMWMKKKREKARHQKFSFLGARLTKEGARLIVKRSLTH